MNRSVDDQLSRTQPLVTVQTMNKTGQANALLTRDLNQVVRRILIVGLIVSAMLMLIGLGLDLISSRTLTTETFPPGEALRQAMALRSSGFYSLGLIMLMLTPLMRVIGSVIVFIWERDWRYAGITALVILVMLISLWVGLR